MSLLHVTDEDCTDARTEFLRADTGEVVHRIVVTGPGAIEVPPLGRRLGVRIDARVVPCG